MLVAEILQSCMGRTVFHRLFSPLSAGLGGSARALQHSAPHNL